MTTRHAALVLLLPLILPSACSSNGTPSASCQSKTVQCADLVSSDIGRAYCDLDYGCSLNYSCAGTASCSHAPDSFTCSQLQSYGCSNGASGCTGAATACSDAIYQANSEACADVGCTLTQTCGGGTLRYPCNKRTTQTECEGDSIASFACEWK